MRMQRLKKILSVGFREETTLNNLPLHQLHNGDCATDNSLAGPVLKSLGLRHSSTMKNKPITGASCGRPTKRNQRRNLIMQRSLHL